MKRKYSTETRLFVFFMLISMVLAVAPKSYAQSVQTWSEPVNLSMSGAATNPSLIVDSKGTLHVFWVDTFSGYQYITSTDGITWSTPKAVKFPFNSDGLPPRWIVDATGLIHLFWISDTNALMYAKTADASIASPTAWRVMTTIDSSVYDFDAAVDANGGIHLNYIKNPKAPSNEFSGVYYIQSINGGIIWQQKELLYESAYFRSIDSDSAHVRVAVSNDPENQTVYSVWDDRAQKRIFMRISRNGGQDWEELKEIVAPDATHGLNNPFASDIELLQGKVLLTWQVGEPGVRCGVYSRASQDNGESWDEPVRVLADTAQCPETTEFLSVNLDYSVMLLNVQGGLSMVVWNGSEWSNPESQTGPSSITNPTTFETVLLGCRIAVPFNNRLFVIGCDQGGGGDIWFTSREFDPLESVFPLPSAWGLAKDIATVSQKITSVSSVSDTDGNVHVLWIQSAPSETDVYEPRFMYAHWNGSEWSKPAPVITELGGFPVHPSLAIDTQQRLLLTWVNETTGDLLFSWASSARANIPREWTTPVVLPSPSRLNDSPSIVVDAANRIVIAYAVFINENRGIYLTQSTDQGVTWAAPQQVFDAVAAEVDQVNQPKLTFTGDGALHLLFTQYSAHTDQNSATLYYSQSADGGISWSIPEAVSENKVTWSYILAASQQNVHRFWQEKNKLVTATYHQVSHDGGRTWNAVTKINSNEIVASAPAISMDWEGNIHLLQTTFDDFENMNEWLLSNDRWRLIETKRISARSENTIDGVQMGVTANGVLYALLHSESTVEKDELESELKGLDRSLQLTTTPVPSTALIAEPASTSVIAETPETEFTDTTPSVLVDIEDASPPASKNVVGLILVIGVVVLILATVVPKKKQ